MSWQLDIDVLIVILF